MRFLADESVDFPIIDLLRRHGFDVRCVSEEFPSKEDEFVLEAANVDDRLLITSDKDFGELVYRLKKVNKGVILLRIEELKSIEKAELAGPCPRKPPARPKTGSGRVWACWEECRKWCKLIIMVSNRRSMF